MGVVARAALALPVFVFAIFPTASQIVPEVPNPAFVDDFKDPKYIVALRTKASDQAIIEDANTVMMTDKNGQRFACQLPVLHEERGGEDESFEPISPDGATTTADKNRPKSPGELLDSLGNACFYRVEGWWTYELCYNQHVRQFHQERDTLMSEFFLGRFDKEATLKHHQTLGKDFEEEAVGDAGVPKRFHSQIYTNGTHCDLTQEKRSTEVQFSCSTESSNNIVVSIKEPTTCHYTMVFYTPILCGHQHFKQEEEPVHHIKCQAISDPDVEGTADSEQSTSSSSDAESVYSEAGAQEASSDLSTSAAVEDKSAQQDYPVHGDNEMDVDIPEAGELDSEQVQLGREGSDSGVEDISQKQEQELKNEL